MKLAAQRYRSEGWAVKDVSATRPYDLACKRGTDEMRVEVKGSMGDLVSVQLTRNEVTHARGAGARVALAVVEGITLKGSGASGGRLRLLDPWVLGEDALVPLTYSYRFDF
jgi:hypothetical protein